MRRKLFNRGPASDQEEDDLAATDAPAAATSARDASDKRLVPLPTTVPAGRAAAPAPATHAWGTPERPATAADPSAVPPEADSADPALASSPQAAPAPVYWPAAGDDASLAASLPTGLWSPAGSASPAAPNLWPQAPGTPSVRPGPVDAPVPDPVTGPPAAGTGRPATLAGQADSATYPTAPPAQAASATTSPPLDPVAPAPSRPALTPIDKLPPMAARASTPVVSPPTEPSVLTPIDKLPPLEARARVAPVPPAPNPPPAPPPAPVAPPESPQALLPGVDYPQWPPGSLPQAPGSLAGPGGAPPVRFGQPGIDARPPGRVFESGARLDNAPARVRRPDRGTSDDQWDGAGPGRRVDEDEYEPRPRRSRRVLVGAAIGGLLVVGLGVGVAIPSGLLPGAAPAPRSIPPAVYEVQPPPVLSAAGTGAPVPSQDSVAAAIQSLLADPLLGPQVNASVVDVASGALLFDQNISALAAPASTMKLATALAVLATRGPAYQIPTRVVAGDNPGEVVIIGGGDPTLSATATPSYPDAATLPALAAQVRQALGGTAPTKVIVDSSQFSGPTVNAGWDPTDVPNGETAPITALATDGGRKDPHNPDARKRDQRFAQPDLSAGRLFAQLLGVSSVTRGSAPAPPATGAAATSAAGNPVPGGLLGQVFSAPLVEIIEYTLTNSDNDVAEYLARQVAIAKGDPASFAGAAQAVTDTLTGFGISMAGTTLTDGSGLSHTDQLTAQVLTSVLSVAASDRHPDLHALFTGLPVAGYSGTLANRYRNPAAGATAGAGVVRAKTGTLSGVSSLAGVVIDAQGRLLAFAFLADHVVATVPAEQALDRAAAALAALS